MRISKTNSQFSLGAHERIYRYKIHFAEAVHLNRHKLLILKFIAKKMRISKTNSQFSLGAHERNYRYKIHYAEAVHLNRHKLLILKFIAKKMRISKTNSQFSLGAHERIRTSTPNGTTPSRWHVYQFHHVRVVNANIIEFI
jgi:hypothetical protein